MDAVWSGKGEGAIGVDFDNWKWAIPRRIEFGLGCLVSNKNVVIHSKVSGTTLGVGTKETLVDLELSGVPDG